VRARRNAVPLLLFVLSWAPAQVPTKPEAAAHIGKAVRLMQDRLLGEAAAEFEQALALDPENDEVRIQYATCLFAQERNGDARKEFEFERKRLGELPGLNYYLGRLDLRANDSASAIRRLTPLESNPAFPKASLYLGLAYLAAGQLTRAVESLERAARANPRDPEVHYRLARVYSMSGRTTEADREYQFYRDSRENQRLADQNGHECTVALKTQPIAQARAICNRIADPNDARRLILLGQLYCENGAFSDALEPLRRAVQLEPESFEAWQYLGLSLFRLGRYQESLAPLRRSAGLNPRYFNSLVLLASALHALGDDAAALPVLEQAHELNPQDTAVAARIEQLRAARKGRK